VNALTDLGAAAVVANRVDGQVLVEYDAAAVSVADMRSEIAECGYEVIE